MADVELTGKIKLTADISQAKKEAAKLETDGKKAVESATSTAKKPVEDAVKNISSGFVSGLRSMFAGIQRSMAGIGGGIGAIGSTAAQTGSNVVGAIPAGAAAAGGIGLFGSLGALAAGAAAVAVGFKMITERIIDFGRSLSDSSPMMAQLFAEFDVAVMQIKRVVGDALAPAMRELLQSVLTLGTNALPLLIDAITWAVNKIHDVLGWAQVAGKATPGIWDALTTELGTSMLAWQRLLSGHPMSHEELSGLKAGLNWQEGVDTSHGLLQAIKDILQKSLDKQMDEEAKKFDDLTANPMFAFNNSMTDANSPQAQYQKEFYQQRGLPVPNVKVPPRKPGG